MNADECAMMAAKGILTVVRGSGLSDEALLLRIQTIVRDAITAATPPLLPELYPGQDAKVQQALATIDAARLHRMERERAANDRRQGEERRGVIQQEELRKP